MKVLVTGATSGPGHELVHRLAGKYFNGVREARPDPQALDPDARRRLRELSAELVGL